MYIPAFWLGVGATLAVEFTVLIVAALCTCLTHNKEDKK